MSPIAKKFFDYVKENKLDHNVPDFELKNKGWTDQELEELKQKFRKNSPDKLYKDGECYKCGETVDGSEKSFDAQIFHCSCGISLKGNESERQCIMFGTK